MFPGLALSDVIDGVVIHHFGSGYIPGEHDISGVQENHMGLGLGGRDYPLSDIMYNFVIQDGRIYEGRGLEIMGAAMGVDADRPEYYSNIGRVSIMLMGDYNNTDPQQNDVEALKDLVTWLNNQVGIDYVYGHNDFDVTDCPGLNGDGLVDQVWQLILED
jgi:hypothetical protein